MVNLNKGTVEKVARPVHREPDAWVENVYAVSGTQAYLKIRHL